MNKIILILAGIVATMTWVSDASALPLLARQTGMACSACHFQHFPMLTGFGRAFKSAGYTMIAIQGKVEGEELSIPSTLNMSALTTAGYEKSNQAVSNTVLNTTGDGAFYVPGNGGELDLFVGGRVSGNTGFLAEVGTGGYVSGSMVSGTRSSAKLPVLFEVDSTRFKLAESTRIGFVPFGTDDEGASYGFELLNTGANAVQQMSSTSGLNEAHSTVLSAQQYIGTAGPATGVALVASNPVGFINLTKYDQIGISHGALAVLGSTYVRVAGMFDLAGWDTGVGIQNWSGYSVSATGTPAVPATSGNGYCTTVPCTVIFPTAAIPATYGIVSSRATAIDGQAQGSLASLPVGLYASYARAPAGNLNSYNMDPVAANTYGTATKSAFNVAVEVGVIPEKVTLGAALRRGRSGVAVGSASNASDNAIMLMATYKLAQNMMASFSLTYASGEYWDTPHQDALGSKTTTINLFTLF